MLLTMFSLRLLIAPLVLVMGSLWGCPPAPMEPDPEPPIPDPGPYPEHCGPVVFDGQLSPIRLRLTHHFGRSCPDLDTDLFDPIEAELGEDQVGQSFIDFPVPSQTVFLEPTEHYILLAEQLDGGPVLGVETLPEGEYSRAMMHGPDGS